MPYRYDSRILDSVHDSFYSTVKETERTYLILSSGRSIIRGMTPSQFSLMIDHTLLKPEATEEQIERLCGEALSFRFGAVCIAPVWVPLAAERLRDQETRIVTVIGFPLGNTLSRVKAFEARAAIEAGADELDMVMQVGLMKSGDERAVLDDIRAVVGVSRERPDISVKVILEAGYLTDEEKRTACRLAEEAGAGFVKTSTGFGTSGATEADVTLLRRTVGERLGVKAAGGIRDLATALAMIRAGANRLGCSSSVSLMEEFIRSCG